MTNKKYLLISALFLIVSAAAICMSVVLSTTVKINDGEWAGAAEGRNGPIELVLTVQDGKIAGVRIVAESETSFAKDAESDIIEQAIRFNRVTGLDALSGATITSNAMMDALADAYNKALAK
ncbi:MAG: FMN-binding protein [Spirochaetaceae bacterium]|nr:FMN-binding protein [Spirochaetaceae bacterium]